MKKFSLSRCFCFGLPFLLLPFGLIHSSTHPDKATKVERLTNPDQILQFKSANHIVGFADRGVYVAGGSHALHIEFVNQHHADRLVHDLFGNVNSASLSKVDYANLWSGVTLSYDAPEGAIARSTYRINPQANVGDICLRYNAPVSLQSNGSLRIKFNTGAMNESAPLAWQERAGKRVPVQVVFALRGAREVGFAVGDYDRAEPLFIDPTLTWNTFLGSTADDQAYAIAVDLAGNSFVTGLSNASWGTPIQPWSGGYDAFVAKLDTAGNLIWNTFVGGAGDEAGQGIALDGSGNVCVAGFGTASWGAPIHSYTGGNDAFVAKLDPNGNLIWNTFLGSAADDNGQAVAADGSGNVYLAGYSNASWGTPVRAFGGLYDGFAAKLDSAGNLVWNTFLGSPGTDMAHSVAVDVVGNVYAVGFSTQSWETPVRPYSGASAAFAAKLDPIGNLVWNTFLGGGDASAKGVTADLLQNVYVAGFCNSTWGDPVRPFDGTQDAFATKLDSGGNLVWNTFLGASPGQTVGQAITLDLTGNVYVAGNTDSVWESPVPGYNGGVDAFAVKLDPNGGLLTNSYLGSGGTDIGFGVGVDSVENVYITGYSDHSWGSPIRPHSPSNDNDGFVAKLFPATIPTPSPTPIATPTPTATPTPSPSPSATPLCEIQTSITSNFNGTPILPGSTIWFNCVLKPNGLGSRLVTFRFTQQTITSSNFTITVPDSEVTFDPTATSASTTFTGGMWVTRVPSSGLAGNTFLSAVEYQAPSIIPGGLDNVTWSGVIVPSQPGAQLQWKWAAAVYSVLSPDYNALGVKPVDDDSASPYQNSDHAGTPENFKLFVIPGARGGGGNNYTGGYSGTEKVGPCP